MEFHHYSEMITKVDDGDTKKNRIHQNCMRHRKSITFHSIILRKGKRELLSLPASEFDLHLVKVIVMGFKSIENGCQTGSTKRGRGTGKGKIVKEKSFF